MNDKTKLYYAAPSPFARKVRVAIREFGMAKVVDEVEVHTTPTLPNEDLTSVNPLSKIPTLVTIDGEALFDSRVILEYIGALKPEAAVHKLDGDALWKSLRRQALADGILDAGLLHRYEMVLRPENLRWPEWLDAQQGKILRGLESLASDVPPIEDHVGLDAIAVACTLGWLEYRMPNLEWRKLHPTLSVFLDAMSLRSSMAETAP